MNYLSHDRKTHHRIYLLVLALALWAGLGLPPPVSAYVLDGAHLLDIMIKQLGTADRLLVKQQLVINHWAFEQDAAELKETVRYSFPDRFRSDTISGSIQRVHINSRGTALTVMDGKIASEPESEFDLYKDLLLYHSRILLQNRLIRLGVDVETSSIGRFENRIAYVIGANYPDETRSQVWIDKETFQPTRWLLIGSGMGGELNKMEFRYTEWRQTDTMHYPMRIQLLQDGVLLREIRAESVDIDPHFDAELFNIDLLRTMYDPEPSDKAHVDDTDIDMDEVQKTIQEFKKRFE